MEERTTLELKINICEAEKMNIAINVSQRYLFYPVHVKKFLMLAWMFLNR